MSETPVIDDATIEDLRTRLRATRWPDAPAGTGWSLGVDVDELRPLVAYWADGFDFDAHRAALAALPSRRIVVDGTGVHVLHARADATDPLPLLLAHGWPDSGWRYRKVLPMLVAAGFDVVVPDMPGYGFSDAPPRVLDAREVAGMWATLMTDLGYERFAVSGGDIGTHVARYLALDHPDRVVAVHRIDGGLAWPGIDETELSPVERAFVRETEQWRTTEGAYAMMHRTKPQTAAVGLTDSPAGLAAWIVEKLRSWSDCGEDLWSVYTRDEVLALLTEYWRRRRSGRRCGCTTRTRRSRRRSCPGAWRCRPDSRSSRATSSGRRGSGSSARRTSCTTGNSTGRALRTVRGAGAVRRGAPDVPGAVPGVDPPLEWRGQPL